MAVFNDVFADELQQFGKAGVRSVTGPDDTAPIVSNPFDPYNTSQKRTPENNPVRPGENYNWDNVHEAADQWMDEHPTWTECGDPADRYEAMLYDLENAGVINMLDPNEQQMALNNPQNTRENWSNYLDGKPIAPSTAASADKSNWIPLSSSALVGSLTGGGNNPFGGWNSPYGDGEYVPKTIYVNPDVPQEYLTARISRSY